LPRGASLDQYIDALRIPFAVTDEEKELAQELYDQHREAFEAIQAALADTADLFFMSSSTPKTPLFLRVDGNDVSGSSVPELFQKVLHYVVSNNLIDENLLPYVTSAKRYLLSKAPLHPGEKPFRMPVEFRGYYMEAHKSRIQALKDATRFLKRLGCEVVSPAAQPDASADG
jgi:hypothetical protein